jgi:hypothetical protein
MRATTQDSPSKLIASPGARSSSAIPASETFDTIPASGLASLASSGPRMAIER